MNQLFSLTRQETVILNALSSGSLYKEIASDYHISINTVKKHLKNIYRKLGVGKRTQAIERYLHATTGEVASLQIDTQLNEAIAIAV